MSGTVIIFEDDTGRPDAARLAAEKLINKDKVVMLSGGYGSSETFAIAGIAQQYGIPFLVSTGSDNKITEQEWSFVFRLNPPVSEYPRAMESFLKEVVKPQTAAILHENSNFGTSGSKELRDICVRLGIKILLSEGYQSGAVDFRALLAKVKAANPDLIYMISYVTDASLLMSQAMELHITPKIFVGGGAGFTLPEFQKFSGKASEMVFSATLWYHTLPYPGAKEYFNEFRRRFNQETEYHGAEGYASAAVIADVLTRARSLKPEDIKESLTKTDLMTVFGPIKFIAYDKMTNQNKLPTYLIQWINGKQELVWPKDIATAPYVYPIDWERVWK